MIAALAVLMLLPASAGAEATVAVDSLSAARLASGQIRVSGSVDFVGDPLVAATDGGDTVVPAADIAELRITATSDGVRFEIQLANPVAAGPGTVPGVLHYLWEFATNGAELQLRAVNTAAGSASPGAWSYSLDTCTQDPTTGQGSCTGSSVAGSYADGIITFEVRPGPGRADHDGR